MLKLDRTLFGKELNAEADALHDQAAAALYALRHKTCAGAEFTGWYHWPEAHGNKLASEIRTWQASLTFEFNLIVVIGIGGSYLGSRAVSDLTTHTFGSAMGRRATVTGKPMIVFAGHNMSETSLGELLQLMELHKPIVNVISKSGTTTEPSVAFRVVRDFMEKHFPHDFRRRIIATTDGHSGALHQLASSSNYKLFEIPRDVGGRYSVLTAVGLVPLALHGVDIEAMLHGADKVFQDLALPQPKAGGQVALAYAQCRVAAWNHGKRIEVTAYPEPKMRNLVEWWKQLFGESDGKNGKGLFPASLECTMDLHSLGQYLQDGARTMIETFLSVDHPRRVMTGQEHHLIKVPVTGSNSDDILYLENHAIDDINRTALLATRVSHSGGGVPGLEIRIPDFTPESLGSLFAMYEVACAVGGSMLGVNPFNQPGVETYKLKMFELLGKPH
jgi:glucose-6-phosphate isomerase